VFQFLIIDKINLVNRIQQTMSADETRRQELLALEAKRSGIEQELISITELLDAMNGQPGLKAPLVDREGFPRDDVDIFEVRKLRHRHAMLVTDHKNMTKALEEKLYGLHTSFKAQGLVDPAPSKVEGK
jgi:26S proteasome non-ATPase regulatory subunit 9